VLTAALNPMQVRNPLHDFLNGTLAASASPLYAEYSHPLKYILIFFIGTARSLKLSLDDMVPRP
jgi:hypothetical protein